ncbi:FtsW/RodA/SpoVE family cell cycle protein [Clostridium sp. YIM B02505]|uniref:FtsW/RodA/SpoVE family cell cycle protein n=1 Tax=Clostridium yunnanense TaxID=2800325 RepID=A0ABS1ES66_9CLOT|nr:FtsW/RodA/SpoVE family cell cycle protein [Clostridium yunnanense]MBK1812165.1 FtsW/RodA/SpoVE family cell cycle protein [Clostridium yunnanense]
MELKDNERIKAYLNSICCEIKNSKIHSDIQEEFRDHIEEIALEYMDGGFSETEAVNNAIAQMGDAAVIGLELNTIYKQKPEWSVVILTLILATVGLSIIFLIDSSKILGYSLFSKSIAGTLVGLSFGLFLYNFDYMKIKSCSIYIYLITAMIMVYTIILGISSNGQPYLFIGMPINFIDISPTLFIISLAGMLSDFNYSGVKKILYVLILLVVPVILMTVGHSLSATLTYCTSVLVLLIMSGVKIKKLCIFFISSFAAFSFYLFIAPYHMNKLLILLKTNIDPLGKGYFNSQSNELFHSAGKFGHGLSLKGNALPEAHTDFIFTYIVYTFGWIAGLLLTLLIIAFLVRMASITLYVKNSYGKLLIYGFISIFTVQFLWNILMNLGFVPITSMNLPFISYGNSQFVINMAIIGLISSVYKQRNIKARATY